MIYEFNQADGSVKPAMSPFVKIKPGAGPRHLVFHPAGRFSYLINEFDSTVNVFSYNASEGSLKELQTISSLPENFIGKNTGAEIGIAPSGRFLYASNRGHDSIAVFTVDQESGRLSSLEHTASGGKNPRFFGIDPSGRWLLSANQSSDNITVFKIDAKTGKLKSAGKSIEIGSPVCITFIP
jgi:6-phosphogluconolactonase